MPNPAILTPPKRSIRRYGVMFYDTFDEARSDGEALAEKMGGVAQLNIVVKAEGNMDDPELTRFGKVFAGAAWALIHRRRVEDGWYEAEHE